MIVHPCVIRFFVFFTAELDNILHNHFLLVSPKEMPRINEHIT